MATDPRREYLRVRVETASREELLLILFDGLIGFIDGAREAIASGDRERKHALLARAQGIVLELAGALDGAIGEPILSNLRGLYTFAHRRLVDANLRDDPAMLGEARRILDHLRQTWKLAVGAGRGEGVGEARPEARSLSVRG